MNLATKKSAFDAFIASLPKDLGWRIQADAEDNCFWNGPATNDDDPRYGQAYELAIDMAADPKRYGYAS